MSSVTSPPDPGQPEQDGRGDPRFPLRTVVIFCIAAIVALCAGGAAWVETAAVLIAAHVATTFAVAAGLLAGAGAGALAGLSVAVALNRLLA